MLYFDFPVALLADVYTDRIIWAIRNAGAITQRGTCETFAELNIVATTAGIHAVLIEDGFRGPEICAAAERYKWCTVRGSAGADYNLRAQLYGEIVDALEVPAIQS